MKIFIYFFCLLFLSLVFIACAIPTSIDVDSQIPPTFHCRGDGSLLNFVVQEVDTKSYKQTTLWKIEPETDISLWDYPSITYGVLPKHFKQVFPSQGFPPILESGKLYIAGGLGLHSDGVSVWFKVEEGKIIKVPPPL